MSTTLLKSTEFRKAAMLKALGKTLGVITSACRLAHVSRARHYVWYREDEEYRKEVNDMSEIALDFAESQLHKNMMAQKEASIIFYLKTKGKRRGYIERVEIDDAAQGPKRFNLQVLSDEETIDTEHTAE